MVDPARAKPPLGYFETLPFPQNNVVERHTNIPVEEEGVGLSIEYLIKLVPVSMHLTKTVEVHSRYSLGEIRQYVK